MTEKQIARFKVKFPKLNLSKARLDSIKLKLDDEADDDAIDEKLDEVNEMYPFADILKSDDRIRTDAVKEKEKQQKEESKNLESDKSIDSVPGDIPEGLKKWAEGLTTAFQTITSELTNMKAGNASQTRKQTLEAALKDVSAPAKAKFLKDFDRMSFKDDAAFQEYLEETKTDITQLVQSEADASLARQSTPFQSSTPPTEKKVTDDIASWAKATNPAPATTAK